jgi:sugar phosphate isomerase/epimerase
MDTTHLGTWDIDPVNVYDRFGGKVRHVHLSNFDGREHRRPEVGHLRLDALLARMAADGFAGTVALELHPDTLDAGREDAHIVTLLAESPRRCREWAAAGAKTAAR